MKDPSSKQPLTSEEKRVLLAQILRQRAEESRVFPMSFSQQGLWYAFRRDPLATSFNVFLPSRVRAKIDIEVLKKSFLLLVERHACLRTRFSDRQGSLLQIVEQNLPPEMQVLDTPGMSHEALQERLIADAMRPFDLEQGPLMRLAFFRLADDDWVILATTHHIVVDFWSLILILKELREIYPALLLQIDPKLAPPQSNYNDFVREQAQFLKTDQGLGMKHYWQATLRQVPPIVEMPIDLERPAAFTGRANIVPLHFDPRIVPRLNRLASLQRTTSFAVVQAAVQVLISRYSGQKSFVIGNPFSGRRHQKYESTVGFFVNMLPIRADLEDDPTFETLVRRVGQTLIGALENQDYPFSLIVQDAAPPRDPSRSPLFQISCTFEKSQIKEEKGRASFLFPVQNTAIDFSGMAHESFYVPQQTCHHDVEFIFEQTESSLLGMVCYCRDLFTVDSMRQLGRNLEILLIRLLDQPTQSVSKIAWLDEEVTEQVASSLRRIESSTNSSSSDAATTVLEWINDWVAKAPDIPAIQSAHGAWTYAQLGKAAAAVRDGLMRRGAGPGTFIPIFGPPTPQMVIAILGVWQTGAVPIPIDASKPSVRWTDLIGDTQTSLAIACEDSVRRWITDAQWKCVDTIEELQLWSAPLQSNPKEEPLADQKSRSEVLAYVLYTSGTTGRAKGVMVDHQNLSNTIGWRRSQLTLLPGETVLWTLSHQFDAGLATMLTALTQGGTLHCVEPSVLHDMESMTSCIMEHQIAAMSMVPSQLRLLIGHRRFPECSTLRQFWVGGESMPRDLPSLLQKRSKARLWNLYGPTEATIEATAYDATDHPPSRSMLIGKPIHGMTVLVLDESMQPLPLGVPGEVVLAGKGIAQGYLGRTEETTRAFIEWTFDGRNERIYRTGDRGRLHPDGQLEFLGRLDDQVKLRGFRLELGEIETAMLSHPQVQHAACKIVGDGSDAKLVGYVGWQGELPSPDAKAQFLRYLSERLPMHKIPSTILYAQELPLLSSGKVDRKRLPEIDTFDDASVPSILPATPFEAYLAQAWSMILDRDEVGTNQNFFALGGTSLQAATLAAQLTDDLGFHVPTALLFDLADIGKIARRLVQFNESKIAERFGRESANAYVAEVQGESELANDPYAGAWHHPLIASLKPSGTHPALFLVHPPGGIVACYRELADHFDPDRPLYAIRSRGLHGQESLPKTLSEMAREYVEAIQSIQPQGPYFVGGWSLGGIAALEIAQQLLAAGEQVGKLLLLDTAMPEGSSDLVDQEEETQVGLEYGIDMSLEELSQLRPDEQLPFLWQHAKSLGVLREDAPRELVQRVLSELRSLFHHHVELATNYRIGPFDGDIVLFRPKDVPFDVQIAEDRHWGKVAKHVDVRYVPGHHHSMVQEPNVQELADQIEQCLSAHAPSPSGRRLG